MDDLVDGFMNIENNFRKGAWRGDEQGDVDVDLDVHPHGRITLIHPRAFACMCKHRRIPIGQKKRLKRTIRLTE